MEWIFIMKKEKKVNEFCKIYSNCVHFDSMSIVIFVHPQNSHTIFGKNHTLHLILVAHYFDSD